MSVETTRDAMEAYWAGDHDVIAESAVYTNVATGERWTGRDEISRSMGTFYRETFPGDVDDVGVIVGDGRAVWEGRVHAVHASEYGGLPATGRRVELPIVVSYDLRDDRIVAARIYVVGDALYA